MEDSWTRARAHESLLVVGYAPPDNAASHLLAYKATASLALGSGLFRPMRERLDVSVVSTLRRASKWLPHLNPLPTDSPGSLMSLGLRRRICLWLSPSIAWRVSSVCLLCQEQRSLPAASAATGG
jgi:hypothetical protein